jgi:uncharacterized membrane protein YraQ (UPF0718 family)
MIRKGIEKVGVSWIFFIVVAIIYVGIAFVNINEFKNLLSTFLRMFLRIIPVLVIVFGIIFFSNLFIEPKNISKHIGKGSGIKGWMIVIFGGILSTGPIYLWYPLLSDLKEKGMRVSFIAAFLYNRAIKIPLMPMMILYFGIRFTVILTIYMIIFSMINGFLVEKLLLKKEEGGRE